MFLAAIATALIGSSVAVSACEPTGDLLTPVRLTVAVDGAKRIKLKDEGQALAASIGTVAIFAITTNSSGRVVSHNLVCTTMNDAALSFAQQSLQRYVFKSGEPLKGQILLHAAWGANESN